MLVAMYSQEFWSHPELVASPGPLWLFEGTMHLCLSVCQVHERYAYNTPATTQAH
jgi:hypothetical protein